MSPHFIILYVDSPAKSEVFYSDLLGSPAVESAPTFVMFAMRDGLMLGLWGKDGVKPAANAPGGMEIGITVASKDDVDARHADLAGRGVRIIQSPVAMDFGYTLVAEDLDGHRIRIFAPGAMA